MMFLFGRFHIIYVLLLVFSSLCCVVFVFFYLFFFYFCFFFFSSRRRHTRFDCDWSSDVCSSDLAFTSRLNMSLREKHGFTYGVSSTFAMRRAPGPFLVSTAVQTEVTAAAVREIFREIEGIRAAPVTEGELVDARNYVAGVFPLTLQTTSGVASRLAELVLYGLPHDYFDQYPAQVLAVSAQEVHRVANRYLSPDQAAVVIAGDASRIREEIEALDLGPVEVVDPGDIA